MLFLPLFEHFDKMYFLLNFKVPQRSKLAFIFSRLKNPQWKSKEYKTIIWPCNGPEPSVAVPETVPLGRRWWQALLAPARLPPRRGVLSAGPAARSSSEPDTPTCTAVVTRGNRGSERRLVSSYKERYWREGSPV